MKPSLPRDLEVLAELLDSKFKGPFGIKIGWDGIVGLIPVVGDLLTTLLSGYIVVRAGMSGTSLSVLIRMGLNVLMDNVISAIPFLGWLGDFFWRSNLKNIELAKIHARDPVRSNRSSKTLLTLLLGGITLSALGFACLAGIVLWKGITFLLS